MKKRRKFKLQDSGNGFEVKPEIKMRLRDTIEVSAILIVAGIVWSIVYFLMNYLVR